MRETFLFSELGLPSEIVLDLRRQNPWWGGKPLPELPPHRRHLVGQIHRRLERRLAPLVVVRGSRQIGKTTDQLHVVSDLLSPGIHPRRIFRVQFDELREFRGVASPILRLVDWYEKTVLGMTCNEAARLG